MVIITEKMPRRRFEKPLWELTDEAGNLLGYVRQHSMSGARAVFYKAIGIHPETQQYVTLESSTDRDERIAKILEFRADPDKFRGVHWHPVVAGRP